MIYEWDESKRLANLEKHGLDFEDAKFVYESDFRFDVHVVVNGEPRLMAFAYIFDVLSVLTLVVTQRDRRVRCISYRYAHTEEREVYYEWLANDFKK